VILVGASSDEDSQSEEAELQVEMSAWRLGNTQALRSIEDS
jgi:hypothetical protein